MKCRCMYCSVRFSVSVTPWPAKGAGGTDRARAAATARCQPLWPHSPRSHHSQQPTELRPFIELTLGSPACPCALEGIERAVVGALHQLRKVSLRDVSIAVSVVGLACVMVVMGSRSGVSNSAAPSPNIATCMSTSKPGAHSKSLTLTTYSPDSSHEIMAKVRANGKQY